MSTVPERVEMRSWHWRSRGKCSTTSPRFVLAAGVVEAWCQCTCGSAGEGIDGSWLCVSPNVVFLPLSELGDRDRDAFFSLV